MLQFLGSLGAIVLVDLALSGDNALIIGAAAAGLAPRQRTLAILGGGGAAIVLRVLFAVAATLLLEIPLLEAIGGIILIIIAARLLVGRSQHRPTTPVSIEAPAELPSAAKKPAASFAGAMLTILVADVTMSLDNILAVGGIARGDLLALSIGLFLSIALLLVGAAIVASLIGRLPWLLDLAALALGWTAGSMIYHDKIVGHYLTGVPFADYVYPATGALIVLLLDIGFRLREGFVARSDKPTRDSATPTETV